MTTELTMLSWTIVLGIAQLFAAAIFFTARNGLPYGLGPRDTPPIPLDGIGGRLERAFKNFLETFPIAAAAILIAAVANRHNGYTVWGSQLYFWGRLIYVPLYAAGIPGIRTAAFAVATGGIVLVLLGLAWG